MLRTFDERVGHMDVTAGPYRESAGWDPVTRMQHVDLFTWLRGDILVKADKMTMANSLELRVPFLDPEVFKIAAKIPLEEKITKETTKYALRQALRQIVPAHVLNRRKLGFPVPIRHWLRDEMYDWARQIVLEVPGGRGDRQERRAAADGGAPRGHAGPLAGGSGRCWCTCCGTGSSWSGASSRGSPSRSTR